MVGTVHFELPLGGELKHFRLPAGVQRRLKELLDFQDGGQALTAAERREAEGLVELAEWRKLWKLTVATSRAVSRPFLADVWVTASRRLTAARILVFLDRERPAGSPGRIGFFRRFHRLHRIEA